MFRNFKEMEEKVRTNKEAKKVVVVSAHDDHTLEAVIQAQKDQIVYPILLGNQEKILKLLKHLRFDANNVTIMDLPDDLDAANMAVELIHAGRADFIMKGKIQTAELLKSVVNKEKGLGIGKLISHIALYEVPNYHKLLAITDGGMVMYPNLAEKKCILENAVDAFLTLGYSTPKIAVLTAVETVNPKMPETVDADMLKKMNDSGEIKNCIVEGPISYDLTMSKESAHVKGYQSEVTGDADILLVPTITVGNILGKALSYSANAKMAGIVVGAKVPIVLTSRGSSREEKYLSLVLSAAAVK